jgi:ElaB/YqjD/DUF883 family membrane-anchored ribosome-binding protein
MTAEGADQGQRTPEEIERDIEQTRQELGDTAAALAQKADVKGQAQAKLEDVKSQAREKVESVKDTAREKTETFSQKAREATPESAGAAAQQAAGTAKENPVPLAIAGAFAAGFVTGWILKRR